MIDNLGRSITYLRLSITEKCDLSCIYCNPLQNDKNVAEIGPMDFQRIVGCMVKLGVNKVRITGGEPLVREDVVEIVRRVSSFPEIEDICLTTNGVMLHQKAQMLKDAGLRRVNISLDSLQPKKFRQITGKDVFEKTFNGIYAALEADLSPVKVNIVLIKGINDDEVLDFVNLAKINPIEVRFIELMPIGKFGENNSDKIIKNSDLLASMPFLTPLPRENDSAPSVDYTGTGFLGKVGFISPMSHLFCHDCNRIRVTADGFLRPCLGTTGEVSLKEVLAQYNDEELFSLIKNTIYNKPIKNEFQTNFHSKRTMNRIGG